MASRTQSDPEALRQRLINLLEGFEQRLAKDDLRAQVCALVPAVHLLRELGSSLMPSGAADGARDRILHYLKQYPRVVVSGDELGVVSGISEYARRIRELRVQFGWPIFAGRTVREILDGEGWAVEVLEQFGDRSAVESYREMKADDYILIGDQDRDAAHRWNVANSIRNLDMSVRDRILLYLRQNTGQPVTGEELRYVAKGATEWGRRTRELRTQEGWPVATRSSGRPDLNVGVYVLEADRQLPTHDRQIADPVRVAVLERDHFQCQYCGWDPKRRASGDPRTLLEIHHIEHHVDGGSNTEDNLIVLCNVHHDDAHRQKLKDRDEFFEWLRSKDASSNPTTTGE